MTQPVFDDCLTAKLHLTTAIQPHGALLVLDNQQTVVGASQNIGHWLHRTPEQAIGTPWHELFPDTGLPAALNELSALGIAGIHLRPCHVNGHPVVLAGHKAGAHSIIELEERNGFSSELLRSRGAILSSCTYELGRAQTSQQAAECLMRFIALSIGFDRVMLLQFMPDWHGKVTAEILQPGARSYLHQHFPANDIPQNARTLYVQKRQRLIANARAEPVPVVNGGTEAFDLTHAELRAVHPAHIQYMKNMGVAASFSVSIVVDGSLWGLVVCHSLKPRTLPFSIRQLCEHMANTAALHISGLQKVSLANERHAHSICRTRLKQEFLSHGLTDTVVHNQLEHIRRAFSADGAWAHRSQSNVFSGSLPGPEALKVLQGWLQSRGSEPVQAFNEIDPSLADHASLVRHASGLLFIRITDVVFLVLMRGEQRENIEWAGPPDKPGATSAKLLSPRTSFEAWKELTAGQALPWVDHELEAAHELRLLLRELLDYLSLEQQSLTDPLTGLGNRQQLQNHIDRLAQDPDATGLSAVLLMDLDHFKPVNDTYGHAAGDQVLTEVGERIRALVRDTDLAVRLGGDEFAIVLSSLKHETTIQALGERLIDAVSQPYHLERGRVSVSASVGAAVLRPGDTLETALHNADMAMYSIKRSGRNGFALYSDTNS